MTKFKVGDKVKRKDDGTFSNNERVVTLDRVCSYAPARWWIKETGNHIGEDEIESIPTHFPLYSEEAAVKLLEERGYQVKAPPEPLKGKIVIYDSCIGITSCSYEQWSKYNYKKDCRLIAIVDWTEGQGI